MPIARPRLATHVLVRKHVAGGRATYLAHDTMHGGTIDLGAGGWAIVSGMDGTRDLAGLALFARSRASEGDVARFVFDLEAMGALLDGPALRAGAAPPAAAARPIEALDDFRLRCDGRGSCCRIYPSILFAPEEVARARAIMPDVLDAGADEERAFLPGRGTDRRSLAVVHVDGRCAYLEQERCGIHARSGAAAKPFGCRAYPASLVDDGHAIRVAPSLECACVIGSLLDPSPEGALLVDPLPRTAADLDPRFVVELLPESIALGRSGFASRAAIRDFTDALRRAPPPSNVAARFAALAASVDTGGLALGAHDASLAIETLAGRIEALGVAAARRERDGFRAEADLARQAFAWIAAAACLATTALRAFTSPDPDIAAEEAAYYRIVLFAHHAVPRSRDVTLAEEFSRRATRVVLARAMKRVAAAIGLTDPAFRYPIAILEAMLRCHGLVERPSP